MKNSVYKTYDELPLMLSVSQVAEVLGIGRTNAYELVKEKDFPSLNIGSRIVVPKDARLVSYNINKKQTSPAVAASLEPYDGDILIRFDYLNPDNQITVSLLHEKNSDDFKIVGSAVNVNTISRAWSPVQVREFIIAVLVVCFAAYVLAGVFRRRF